QAEDGIRDKLVTGVQTCALPISVETDCRCATRAWRDRTDGEKVAIGVCIVSQHIDGDGRGGISGRRVAVGDRRGVDLKWKVRGRSEERRVGKEGSWGVCVCGWRQ